MAGWLWIRPGPVSRPFSWRSVPFVYFMNTYQPPSYFPPPSAPARILLTVQFAVNQTKSTIKSPGGATGERAPAAAAFSPEKSSAMRPSARAININACARKVEVDNRLSLHYYYRIADNLLKQARIYREEKNLIDLYIILLRFSSLMCETIPSHRDYLVLLPKEKAIFRKELLHVINELESLKPDAQRQVDEMNKQHMLNFDGQGKVSFVSTPLVEKQIIPSPHTEQPVTRSTPMSSQVRNNERHQVVSSNYLQMDKQLKKLSLGLPRPNEETLSRHSILGPNGLRGQWAGPITGTRVQYPSNVDLSQTEPHGLKQDGKYGPLALIDGDSRGSSAMESVLSLDDGRWSVPIEESCSLATSAMQEDFLQLNIRQPSPPPVLAEVHHELPIIPASKVADPRPGPAQSSPDSPSSKTYQNLHIPVKMMESFLKLAELNTKKNLETCGILAGLLKNSMFYLTMLIIPKQESTSDSCQTTDEEEIFNIQDKHSLFPLGWIHTHPTQTCFMSSIDLHTHYSYQIMLPEAIAIVMAPTDTSRTHGIFHLSDPGGVSAIRNCQERGFHPHEELPDGSPIYEHCSHVYMNANLNFDVIDLRNS